MWDTTKNVKLVFVCGQVPVLFRRANPCLYKPPVSGQDVMHQLRALREAMHTQTGVGFHTVE